jgi:hypothetical protein
MNQRSDIDAILVLATEATDHLLIQQKVDFFTRELVHGDLARPSQLTTRQRERADRRDPWRQTADPVGGGDAASRRRASHLAASHPGAAASTAMRRVLSFLLLAAAACRSSRLDASPQPTGDPVRPVPIAVPMPVAPRESPPPPTAISPDAATVLLYEWGAPRGKNPRWFTVADSLPPAEEGRLLDLVFGAGKYLKSHNGCVGPGEEPRISGEARIAAVRARGHFMPQADEAATGAFTAPRVSQTLYVFLNRECSATHAENWGTVTLAVVEGRAVVARVILPGSESVEGVVDLDGDGQNEIVMVTGYSNNGLAVASAHLSRFEKGNLTLVRDFGRVLYSECAAGKPDEKSTTVRAIVRPGAPPEFVMEEKTEACR